MIISRHLDRWGRRSVSGGVGAIRAFWHSMSEGRWVTCPNNQSTSSMWPLRNVVSSGVSPRWSVAWGRRSFHSKVSTLLNCRRTFKLHVIKCKLEARKTLSSINAIRNNRETLYIPAPNWNNHVWGGLWDGQHFWTHSSTVYLYTSMSGHTLHCLPTSMSRHTLHRLPTSMSGHTLHCLPTYLYVWTQPPLSTYLYV